MQPGTATSTRGLHAQAAAAGLAEEVAEHRLAQLEVGDHAGGQRADDRDRLRRAALHLLGQMARRRSRRRECGCVPSSTATTEGSLSTRPSPDHADQRVGGAQVDGQVGAQQSEESMEHPCSRV